jgi:hypothetical protein
MLSRSAAVIALALVAVSCSSGDSGSQVAGLCGPAADSAAGKALREVLGTDDFTAKTMRGDDSFAEDLKRDLKAWGGGPDSTSPSYVCKYVPDGGNDHMLLSFAWSPVEQPAKLRAEGGKLYDVNGSTGSLGNLGTELYTSCTWSGELSEPSHKAVLRADTVFRVGRGDNADGNREKSELSYLSLMTREAAKLLGCQNQLPAKEPVVKPYSGTR